MIPESSLGFRLGVFSPIDRRRGCLEAVGCPHRSPLEAGCTPFNSSRNGAACRADYSIASKREVEFVSQGEVDLTTINSRTWSGARYDTLL